MKVDTDPLDKLFQYVTLDKHSGFYRDLYQQNQVTLPIGIKDLTDWESLPMLTKEDLTKVPLEKRVFGTVKDFEEVRTSSGTTGKELLITPRNSVLDPELREQAWGKKMKAMLSINTPIHYIERDFRCRHAEAVLYGDMSTPELTVAMAAKAEVDAIIGFVFAFDILLPYFKKYGYTDKIKHIELIGEKLSTERLEHLQTEFPNAAIYTHYGASEQNGSVMVSFHNDDPDKRFVMSPWPNYYLELIDPDSGKLIKGDDQIGELVVTTLPHKDESLPSPLLRYRTGDLASRVDPVDVGHLCGYLVHGRIDGERKKITGGEISLERLEKVLSTYGQPGLDLEVQVDMRKDGDIFKPQIELRFVSKDRLDTDELGRFVSRNLKVSPEHTYEDNVARGFYLPLLCSQVDSLSVQRGKRKRLLSNY